MFEKATRAKLRFKVSNGLVTTEDLWDLSLPALDNVAKNLRKELRDTEDSFISATKKDTSVELAFQVVKHVIETKLAERDAKVAAAEKRAKKQKLLEILENKQTNALANMTEEELKKELAALGEES